MNIHIVNPLSDTRWDDLVARHPSSSAFHERGWLEALARTYGYEPVALTSASVGQPLNDGLVLCRVSSPITGTRLVSLPFADHCELLLNEHGEFLEFTNWLRVECDRQRWRYVELRPLFRGQHVDYGLQPSSSYYFHELDIRPSLEQIFRGFHKDSIQRKIGRAERERLSYEVGRSEQLVSELYRLLLITKRRHHLFPQPRAWFRNLVECMGDKMQIALARKNGMAIAAMLTLRHRASVVYKYGCSDEGFHNLGGMPFLFWRLIEEAKAAGAEKIDFGRSDLGQQGLITFKDKFGTTKELITYYRYPRPKPRELGADWRLRAIRRFFPVLPDAVLSAAGGILYRHLG